MSNRLFHDRAPDRIERVGIAIAAVGTLALFLSQGPRNGFGFLCGAVLSLLNFRWWKSLVNSLGATERVPIRGKALILGIRYLLIGGAIYVIVRYLEVGLVAVLVGLFVSIAAAIVEILYELIYDGT